MTLLVVGVLGAFLGSGAWTLLAQLRGRRGMPAFLRAPVLAILPVAALAAWLRYDFVPAHHAMYVDEPWYAEAACNLGREGALRLCEETWAGRACEPYEKAPGWPVWLSMWTSLAGCSSSVGIAVNRFLGTATVALVAASAAAVGASSGQAVFAAALLAVHPTHVEWSATGETNVAAAFALLAGIYGVLSYRRHHRPEQWVLAASGLALATAIRPESLVAAVVIAAASTSGAPSRSSSLAVLSMVALCLLAATSALPLWTMNREISEGGFFSIASIAASFAKIEHAGTWPVHGAVVLLAALGAGALARRDRRIAACLFAAGLAAAAIAMAYDRFAGRMLLAATVCLLPAAAFALAWVAGSDSRRNWARGVGEVVVLLIVGLLWRGPLLATATPAETQLLETRLAASVGRYDVPPDSLLIAEQPTILAAAGYRRVMSAEEALRDESRLAREVADGPPVFFLADMFCEPGFTGGDAPGASDRCRRMLDNFDASVVVRERIHPREYRLYLLAEP